MSEIRHCAGCDQPRFQSGQGSHLGTFRTECLAPHSEETVMQFWKGNRTDAPFSWPVGAVTDAFMNDYHQRYQAGDLTARDWSYERQLRDFLTDPARFDAIWEDEEAFAEVLDMARERIRASEHRP